MSRTAPMTRIDPKIMKSLVPGPPVFGRAAPGSFGIINSASLVSDAAVYRTPVIVPSVLVIAPPATVKVTGVEFVMTYPDGGEISCS